MTIHGIVISWHSPVWIWVAVIIAWLILCTIFWALCAGGKYADEIRTESYRQIMAGKKDAA